MTFTELYQAYLKMVWELFQYDVGVFSQTWIYYWVLVPAVFYGIFFVIKWTLLTLPIWIIPVMILKRLPTTIKIRK